MSKPLVVAIPVDADRGATDERAESAAYRIDVAPSKARMFPTTCILTAVAVAFISQTQSFAAGDHWYFTAQEIETAYNYQQRFGKRLRDPIKPVDCFYGRSEFIAKVRGTEFRLPCRFVSSTVRHLQQILEKGAARYLFPLDADHAHLAIPVQLWDEKYSATPGGDVLPLVLGEPSLVALYHTAEHLHLSDSEGTAKVAALESWKRKRNVLGFYDGRPVEILPPHADGSGREAPEGYRSVARFTFMAHRLGEIAFSALGKGIVIDVSFDEEATEP